MNTLATLFGSEALVKVMKLFLMNPEEVYDKKDVMNRAKVSRDSAQYELNLLQKVGMIKKKVFYKPGKPLKSGKMGKKKKAQGFTLNSKFKYLKQLKTLLIQSAPISDKDISSRLGKAGRVKLIVTSGVFIQDDESRIDLMIVGDRIKERTVKSAVSVLESEIGKQLSYVLLDTEDFSYRMSVCDRLVRDILDYPHQVIVDKIGLHTF